MELESQDQLLHWPDLLSQIQDNRLFSQNACLLHSTSSKAAATHSEEDKEVHCGSNDICLYFFTGIFVLS